MRFVSTASALAFLALVGSPALAQRGGQSGSQRDGMQFVPPPAPAPGLGGVRSVAPAPMSGLGGVRSAAPAPMPGLGGVRSTAPGFLPNNQSQGQPQFAPMPVGPWPGVVVTPQGSNTTPPAPGFSNTPAFDGRGVFINPGTGPGTDGFHGSFSGGSGFTFNGSFTSDRLRLALHLGSTAFSGHRFRTRGGVPIVWNYPVWWYDEYSPFYGNRYDVVYGYYTPLDTALVYTPPAPQPAPATEAVPPSTNRELADTYLRAGDPRAAIKSYQAHLKQYPGDEEAMRSLGLALIDAGQTQEGVAMIAMAYKAEPLLCDRPFSPDVFRYGADTLSRDLARVSIFANRTKSASGWLAVAVLMQAQRRDDLARNMIERARAAGLETVVADRMTSALR